MKTSLSLLVLRASNLDATVGFYRSLGLQFQQEQHGSGPIHYAAQSGQLVLEIYPIKPNQVAADDTTMLGFQLENLETTLANQSVEVHIKSSEWGRFCTLKDPNGRAVRLSEPLS